MQKYFWILLPMVLMMSGCASTPEAKGPPWTTEPTRIVDNGYIVYVGHGEAGGLQNAQFKAEGMALEDLANECSVIPKGTRIEDRYDEQIKSGSRAFVKLAVEFQECDQASKAMDPQQIKKIGNVAFTQQLQRYQVLNETGELPSKDEVAQGITPPTEIESAPAQGHWNDNVQFYATRQYVAYQKEVVVLAPPTAYQPASPESKTFITAVTPVSQRLNETAARNPALTTAPAPWSSLPDRPHINQPQSLKPASMGQHSLGLEHNAPKNPESHQGQSKHGGGRHGKRKRQEH